MLSMTRNSLLGTQIIFINFNQYFINAALKTGLIAVLGCSNI